MYVLSVTVTQCTYKMIEKPVSCTAILAVYKAGYRYYGYVKNYLLHMWATVTNSGWLEMLFSSRRSNGRAEGCKVVEDDGDEVM